MSNEEQSAYTDQPQDTSVETAPQEADIQATEEASDNDGNTIEQPKSGRGYGRSRRRAEEVIDPELEELISQVIGSAIEVHKALGPGLDREVYVNALKHELDSRSVPYEENHEFEINYKEQEVGKGNIDILVDESLVIAVRTVHRLTLFDKSQMLSNLRASELDVALMLNFHAPLMKDGLQRVIL